MSGVELDQMVSAAPGELVITPISNGLTTMNARTSRFDWVTKGGSSGPDAIFDRDLGSMRNAAILPTKGAIIPNWFLIVPKVPADSIADLRPDVRAGVIAVVSKVASLVKRVSGSAVVFEHGARRLNSPHSCGVDQSHIHVVGLDADFVEYAIRQPSHGAWQPASERDPWLKLSLDKDYLLLSDTVSTWISFPERPVSQYFRRQIAVFLKRPTEWDYREFSHVENAKETARIYEQHRPQEW